MNLNGTRLSLFSMSGRVKAFSIVAIAVLMIAARGTAASTPAPAALIAIAGDGAATLFWEASSGAASYQVKRRLEGENRFRTIARSVKTSTYLDGDLQNGTAYYYVVAAEDAGSTSVDSNQAKATPVAPFPQGAVTWPLSRSAENDADGIAFQYAPRHIGKSYDFHAGIDIPAAAGTPVYPVMDGTVTDITPWNGKRGPGNKILINHGAQKWTAYLHLAGFADDLQLGQAVKGGVTLLGYVGKTGAISEHLHLTYMVGLKSEANSESRSKNPLEILPHARPEGLEASFRTDRSNALEITLPAQHMTVRWIILKGGGHTRIVDYYQVVEQGSRKRDSQSQAGVFLDATGLKSPFDSGSNFRLTVRPDPADAFVVEQVILKDFDGKVIMDALARH